MAFGLKCDRADGTEPHICLRPHVKLGADSACFPSVKHVTVGWDVVKRMSSWVDSGRETMPNVR